MDWVSCINDILIDTKGSLEKYHTHVSNISQRLIDNHKCIEIEKCVFDFTETTFLAFEVS